MAECEWCKTKIDPDWQYGYFTKPDKDGKGGYCSLSCWLEHHGHSKEDFNESTE